MSKNTSPIVIAHLIYRFDIGGLERVMVNCINAMTNEKYRHVIIALSEVSDFAQHLSGEVETYQLNKKSGKDLASHGRLFKLLKKIKPDVLHTYNLAAIEYHPIAWLAGVKGHIHAEHGREISDPQGLNKKHNFLRKLISPFIDHFVPVSVDLEQWLIEVVGIKQQKVNLIRNGIDIKAFSGDTNSADKLRFIHIARFNPVKDQANLLTAFALFVKKINLSSTQVSLTMVGDGDLFSSLTALSKTLMLDDYVIFTGARNDIPTLLKDADVFVLSSVAEGIPMTVLEAMASKLAIISTNVGGLPELVLPDKNGYLVEKQNSEALAEAMGHYARNANLSKLHGEQSLAIINKSFEESAVVSAYAALYQQSLGLT
ncbi:MAG: TIGR03088 family PEP-CTERM/XrtA system glycosyltransferase [Thalassotalea sp.]